MGITVGTQVALRADRSSAIGRVTKVTDVRGDGELMKYTLDACQPGTNIPLELLGSAIVAMV